MAELNFGLLTPPGSQPIGNAFVSGMDQAQAARLQEQQLQQSMQQNALAKAKMSEYQRGIAEQNALRNRMTQPGFDINNPQHQQELLGIAPVLGQTVLQHAATMAKTGAETARFGAQTEEARVKTAKAQQEWNNQALRDLIPNPSDDNLRAWGQDAVIKGIYSLAEANRLVNSYLKIPVEQRADTFKQVGAPAAAPEATPQDIRTMQALGYPNTPAGYTAFRDAQRQDRLLTPAEEAQKTRIALASRPPAAPRAESPTEKVIDPATGKQIIVSREEAISRRMTPAAAGESLPPKEIQKRESVYPTATSAVKGFEAKSESFVKDLKALRDHPGLSSITGILAGRIGGVTADGRAAQALYDKVVAKGGFQALQDLRDASKTGGALGNVSNREGQQLTSSFAAIDQRQDAKDVRAAIDGAIAGVEGARIRTREAYDDTYSYKNPAGQVTPSPAAATIPQAAIDALNAGVGTPAQFDAQFGAGAAARVKGKK